MAIWEFIEKNLDCQVPIYIKNILEVCGYTNAMTISTIEEDDIDYFEGEVQNGSVSKHFGDVTKALEGSNQFAEKDFKFVRGHRKFILKIRDFIKSSVDKNGPDPLIKKTDASDVTLMAPEKKPDEENISLIRKRKNQPQGGGAKFKVKIDSPESISEKEINEHRNVIFAKYMKSLQEYTPNLFNDVKHEITFDNVSASVESKTKNIDESEVEEKTFKLVGAVRCPYCKKYFSVHHEPSKSNFRIWKITNWVRHLKSHNEVRPNARQEVHKKVDLSSGSSSIDNDPIKDPSASTGKISEKSDFPKNDFSGIGELPKGLESGNNMAVASYSKSFTSSNTDFSSKLVNYSDSSDDESDCDAIKKSIKLDEVVADVDDMEIQKEVANVSVVNAIDEGSVSVPILRNGYSSVHTLKNRKLTVVTVNTCGFDSIFSIYACIYFDVTHFREYFKADSKFTMLVKSYYDLFSSKTGYSPSQLNELYTSRNLILKEILNQKIIENEGTIHLDCTTGIGKLFGQLSKEVCPLTSSGIETKMCHKCKATETFFYPFIRILPIDLDLRNMQKYLRFPRQRNRSYVCNECNGKCTVKIQYNNIVVLEVEPFVLRAQKKIAILSLTDTIVVENENFHLFGIIEYDSHLRHFKSHVLRENGKWMTYDDVQATEIEIQRSFLENVGISPYLMFYKKTHFDSNFSDAFVQGITRANSTSNPKNLSQKKIWK